MTLQRAADTNYYKKYKLVFLENKKNLMNLTLLKISALKKSMVHSIELKKSQDFGGYQICHAKFKGKLFTTHREKHLRSELSNCTEKKHSSSRSV